MLARKTLLYFANTIVGAVLGLVALKFIALYMGDTIWGQVGYALAIVGLVNGLLSLGFPAAHIKRYSEGHRRPDSLATFLYVRMTLTLAMVLAVGGFIAFRVLVQGSGFYSTTLTTLVLVIVYYTLRNIEDVGVSTFNAMRETARSRVSELVTNVVRTTLSALVALSYAALAQDTGPLAGMVPADLSWVTGYGSELLALTYVLGAAAATLVSIAYLRRTHDVGSFDPALLSNYWDFARPAFAVTVIGQFTSYIDQLSLGYFWDAATVGDYFGVARITSVLMGIAVALGNLLMPTLSDLAQNGDDEAIRETVHQAHRYTAMITLPIILFIAAFPVPIIRILLSAKFLDAVPVLSLLAVYSLVVILTRPFTSLVHGLDRPELVARVTLVAGFVNIALNLVLVPEDIQALGLPLLGLKATGAARATLVSGLVAYVLSRAVARDLAPLEREWGHVLRQLVAGALMLAVLLTIHTTVLPLTRWYHLFIYPPIGAAAYFLALVGTRGFTREDLDFFVDLVHPMEMLRYLRDELLRPGDDGDGGD